MTKPENLGDRDPKVGDTLIFEGGEWEVTGRSFYKNDEGYKVIEWCCENDDEEAYVLMEHSSGDKFRWFFTRWIDPKTVESPEGANLADWLGSHHDLDQEPPKTLTYQKVAYEYKEATKGTFTEDDGGKEKKTTWEFWDRGKEFNLAVEVWENGKFDSYRGRYIESDQAAFVNQKEKRSHGGVDVPTNPYAVAAVTAGMVTCGLYLITEFEAPFDGVAAVGIFAGLGFAWMTIFGENKAVGALSCAAAAGLAVLFSIFPPLTTLIGLAAMIGAPGLFSALVKVEAGNPGERLRARFFSTILVVAPLAAVGLYHYFANAPGPHTFGQYCLALAPAAAGGVAGYFLSDWVMDAQARRAQTL